jgi:glycerol-3-phosphate O-acyltransferase / dihydroxyacetone phosphate acyltransferase
MRAVLVALCRLLLRIFFRRVEVVGLERVPEDGPVMYTLNHPNGLIDPLFILCLSRRPVSFLAKAPLFRMPVVGWFVRTFECLPVYRKRDGNDPAENRAILRRSVELLSAGNAIAIFPEGTSHCNPRLEPLRTGAARIALSASAESGRPVQIVPVGLHYLQPETFRSDALLVHGEPLAVPVVPLDERLEPPPDAVRDLTGRIGEAIGALTLQAESVRLAHLSASAERVLSATEAQEPSLARRLELQRRLIEGHARQRQRPEVLALTERIETHASRMREHGLPLDLSLGHSKGTIVRYVLRAIALVAVLLPLAVPGWIVNVVTYRAIGRIAFRWSQSADVTATMKMLGGFLLFPLTWLLWGLGLGLGLGWAWGATMVVLGPAGAYAAMVLGERLEDMRIHARALRIVRRHPDFVEWLETERRAIKEAIAALAQPPGPARVIRA